MNLAHKRLILYGIFMIIFNIGDYLSTRIALSMGFQELNPFMDYVIDNGLFGPVKITVPMILLAYILYRTHGRDTKSVNRASKAVLFGMVLFMLAAVHNTLAIIIVGIS